MDDHRRPSSNLEGGESPRPHIPIGNPRAIQGARQCGKGASGGFVPCPGRPRVMPRDLVVCRETPGRAQKPVWRDRARGPGSGPGRGCGWPRAPAPRRGLVMGMRRLASGTKKPGDPQGPPGWKCGPGSGPGRDRDHSMILETTPEPTVRPPSRMAKRRPSSIAIGAISSTVNFRLSPGITISVPEGSSTVPVTSVVRK